MESSDDNGKPRHFYSAGLGDDFRFTIPEQIRAQVCMDYPENPTVFWYYEKTQNLPVIANRQLAEPNYERSERLTYTLYDGIRTEIPKTIRESCGLVREDGTPSTETVYIIAVGDMLTGDTRSAYVLTERKAWELLPNPHPDSIDQDLADQVLAQAPGFLPTPK